MDSESDCGERGKISRHEKTRGSLLSWRDIQISFASIQDFFHNVHFSEYDCSSTGKTRPADALLPLAKSLPYQNMNACVTMHSYLSSKKLRKAYAGFSMFQLVDP